MIYKSVRFNNNWAEFANGNPGMTELCSSMSRVDRCEILFGGVAMPLPAAEWKWLITDVYNTLIITFYDIYESFNGEARFRRVLFAEVNTDE